LARISCAPMGMNERARKAAPSYEQLSAAY